MYETNFSAKTSVLNVVAGKGSQKTLRQCEVLGSRSGDYEGSSLLGRYAVSVARWFLSLPPTVVNSYSGRAVQEDQK
jgi:hypothetical protein